MLLLHLAVRNAFRNVRRSLLTAATVIIGVAVFVVFSSFMNGMVTSMFEETTKYIGQIRVADTDYIERETLQPLYEYLPDGAAVARELQAVPGVSSAYPIVQTGVMITVGEGELGDVFGQATGAPAGWFERIGLADMLTAGRPPEASGELVLGSRLVDKTNAELSDEVILFGQTQDGALSPILGILTGIVKTGSPITDRAVYLLLGDMQEMVDIQDGAIEVIAYTDDLMGAANIVDRLPHSAVFDGATVQAWTNRDPYNQMVPMMSAIELLIGGALVFLTALAIWNTMTMSVLERTGEIGVMRAMGLSRAGSVGIFVVEAAAIAVVGGVLGVLLGMGPSLYLQHTGITFGEDVIDSMGDDYAIGTTMYGQFTWLVAVKGVLLGILMAVVGSFIPSLRAASVQPVEAMRHGR